MSEASTIVTTTVFEGHVLTQAQADAINAMARVLEDNQAHLVAGGTMLGLGMAVDHRQLVEKGMAAFEAVCRWQKAL